MNDTSRDETGKVVRRVKNRKAPGEHELPVENCNAIGQMGLNDRNDFNIAWKQSKIPRDWATAIVCPLYVKG